MDTFNEEVTDMFQAAAHKNTQSVQAVSCLVGSVLLLAGLRGALLCGIDTRITD